MPDPLPPNPGDTSLQQTTTGDRNQTIGQVLGGTVLNVTGGGQITIYQSQIDRPLTSPEAKTSDIGANPYKGLLAFQETDGDRFFGRAKQIADLWSKLRQLHEAESTIRLLPIYGPSGSGKSSLARAGLIPELAKRPIPGYDRARVAVLVPGTHPLEALATVLARIATNDPIPVTKTREFATELAQKTQTNEYDGLRRIADVLPDITLSPLIVLVDQFEEVYTLCETQDERDAFVANLLHAAGDRAKRVSVIITLRSDFLGETQKHSVLNALFAEQGFLVRSMNEEELRQAIAKPAELAGHPLDAATIDLLVNDTEGREGALPLLQFALTRIWEGLAEGKPPAETLKTIGGVGGALAGEAQRIYDALDENGKAIARRLFLGLVQLGEGTKDTRRRALLDSLISYQDQPAKVKQVINLFAAPGVRLITLAADGNTETVEVTHEALFDHWQQLQGWLEGSRSDIRFQRRLDEAVRYWHEQGRPEGNLWRSPDLDLLQRYKERAGENMTALQTKFWRVSQKAERKRLYLRQFGISGLLVSLLLATYQWHRAERQRMRQYEATSKALVSIDPAESIINALAAIGLSRSPFIRFPNLLQPDLVSEEILIQPNQVMRESIVIGHPNTVTSVAISPDSQLIVSGCKDGGVRLWDLQGNPVGAPFRGHQDSILSVAFSSDGRFIISGSQDKTLRLWDLQGNPVGAPFRGHQDSILSVAFSPTEKLIVSGSQDGTLRLWDLQGNSISEPLRGHQSEVKSVAFSPNGQLIVSGSEDNTVKLWNSQGNLIDRTFQFEGKDIESVAFNPSGQYVIGGTEGNTVRLWDLQGNLKGTFVGHQDDVEAVAFSPGGELIASGSEDGTIRLWDLQGNLTSQPFQGHQDAIFSVAFSPDGQHIVSGSLDGTVRVWNLKYDPISNPFKGHQDSIQSVSFSPDGKYIASGSWDGTIRLWDLQGNQIGKPFQGHQDSIQSVSFSPDGKYIASGSWDGTIRLWDLQGNQIGKPFQGHQDSIQSVSFSPDGKYIASGSWDGTVRLWDLQGNQIGKPFQGHQDRVLSVTFSPNSKHIASASWDGTIRVWELQGGSTGLSLHGYRKNQLHTIAFSPNGQRIVGGGSDGALSLWDLQGNLIRQTFRGHQSQVESIVFSPDGQHIVSSGADGALKLWDLQGNPIGQPLQFSLSTAYSIAFSPNGQFIVIGDSDGTVQLLDILPFMGWLELSCNSLRYLSSATPTTDAAREAKRTCQQYAWNNQ